MKRDLKAGADSWRSSANQNLNSLEDEDDGQIFDQFAGKNTTYRESLYTTVIDEGKIT